MGMESVNTRSVICFSCIDVFHNTNLACIRRLHLRMLVTLALYMPACKLIEAIVEYVMVGNGVVFWCTICVGCAVCLLCCLVVGHAWLLSHEILEY